MITLNLRSPILKGISPTHYEDSLGSSSFQDITGTKWSWSKGQHPTKVEVKQRNFNILTDALMYTPEGFIQKNNGQFLRETYWSDSALFEYQGLKNWRTLLSRQLAGNWFSMLLYYSWGYYHWFCDVLPRLYNVQDILPYDTRFIIHKNLPSWMSKSLELMDIPLSRCYGFDGGIPLKIQTLYFAPPVAMTGDHNPEALRWVRDRMLQGIGRVASKTPSLKLYVSRSAARCRHLVNEHELMEAIEPLGFQLVQPERLSFEEQITLFSQAEWIIGPHGAGLTNMLYAPIGTRVIEIFEPSILRRCYYQMSKALNHNHYIVVGDQKQNLENEPNIYLQCPNIDDIFNTIKKN